MVINTCAQGMAQKSGCFVRRKPQIVVLTSYHEDEHIFPALKAGALSYILNDVSADELAAAVRKAAEEV